jgi:threonine dehydrogenase-like Zn-dependent dehydrogenase
VLVKVLDVGIDATDAEINRGLYGEAPEHSDFLIIGHESLGRVEALGAGVNGLAPGDLVVATVRRPDDCPNCQAGEYDMCLTGNYKERGIKGLHGFMSEYFVEEPEYLVKLPTELRSVGVLLEPLSIVEKAIYQAYKIQDRLIWQPKLALVLGAGPIGMLATLLLRLRGIETYTAALSHISSHKAQLVEELGAGYIDVNTDPILNLEEKLGRLDLIIEATGNSTVAFQAMRITGNNGVLCLTGVSAGNKKLEIFSDALNLDMVLGNKAVFGTVNANGRHFEMGVEDMKLAQTQWPGWLGKLINRRLPLDKFEEGLQRRREEVKAILTLEPD